jgi:hypothetical protein
MTWDEVRKQFPGQWVVVEARSARSVGDRRIVGGVSGPRRGTAPSAEPPSRGTPPRDPADVRGVGDPGHRGDTLGRDPEGRMRIRLEDGLPFVEATIVVGGK